MIDKTMEETNKVFSQTVIRFENTWIFNYPMQVLEEIKSYMKY
ncbi:MAG TPA: hypothetical protein PLH52_06640 [Paludibacteraceae bacterium]|nr:hypothetical protein [Paludibacteraceae bacterium]